MIYMEENIQHHQPRESERYIQHHQPHESERYIQHHNLHESVHSKRQPGWAPPIYFGDWICLTMRQAKDS